MGKGDEADVGTNRSAKVTHGTEAGTRHRVWGPRAGPEVEGMTVVCAVSEAR